MCEYLTDIPPSTIMSIAGAAVFVIFALGCTISIVVSAFRGEKAE